MPKFDRSTALGQKHLMYESGGMPTDHIGQKIRTDAAGDYGADPLGDGSFRMVPSGDIVDYAERCRRLSRT